MMLQSHVRPARLGTWSFGIACFLLFVVFILASASAYDGAVAQKAREYEAYTRAVGFAIQQHDARFLMDDISSPAVTSVEQTLASIFPTIPHAKYVTIVRPNESGRYRSYFSYNARDAGILATDADSLQLVYPRITDATLRAVEAWGGAQLVGRMTGREGDVIVVAAPLMYGNSSRAIVLVAFDAAPFAGHVVAATALPLMLMTLMYALLALVYFWLRRRVRTLIHEQDYIAFLAHDIRLPLVGIGWATQYLASDEKRKGIRKEDLIKDIAVSASVLDDWVRRIIDHAREARGTRSLALYTKTDIDLRDMLNRVISVYDLYARARGVTLTIADGVPDHIPAKGSQEVIERALLQVFAYVITDGAAGETITVTYRTGKKLHEITVSGISSFMHPPRGLLQANALLHTHGGELGMSSQDGLPRIMFRLPRRS